MTEPTEAQIEAGARAMYALSNDLSVSGARDLFRAGISAALQADTPLDRGKALRTLSVASEAIDRHQSANAWGGAVDHGKATGEFFALTVSLAAIVESVLAGEQAETPEPEKPAGWARCNPSKFHSKSSAYAVGYQTGWANRGMPVDKTGGETDE